MVPECQIENQGQADRYSRSLGCGEVETHLPPILGLTACLDRHERHMQVATSEEY